ncbi:MAG: hypothetical protein ACR2JD_04885 [Nocardioides sp.]
MSLTEGGDMQRGQQARAVVGPDFDSWLFAREPALHRTATLLTGDEAAGRDLMRPALARLSLVWSGLDPMDADDLARGLLLEQHRHTWGRSSADAEPAVPPGEYDDARAAAWALVLALPARARAVVVLRHHLGLTESEAAALLRLPVASVRVEESSAVRALRLHLDRQRLERPALAVPGDPVRLLADTLHARAETASYVACSPTDIRAVADALRVRRRWVTALAVAALVVVLVTGLAVAGLLGPAPDRPEPRPGADSVPGLLDGLTSSGAPRVAYLVGDLYVGPDGTRRRLPFAHPRSATSFRGDLWVTQLYSDGADTLRRVDESGRQTGRWPTSGDPVTGDGGRVLAWIETADDRPTSLIHRGRDRQLVGEPIWLVGLLGDRVVYNGTNEGGAWVTDLAAEPRAIPGLALARGVDPVTGAVSGTAANGASAVVDAETGVARWRSSVWRPEAFSPDGRYVVAFTMSGDGVEHAILEAAQGRAVTVINDSGLGPGVLDLRWEDAEHVLMLATRRGQSGLLRADLDGTVTEAAPPLPGDEVGGSAYQFAVR